MKNSQKGFVSPILLGLIVLLVMGSSVYFYQKNKSISNNMEASYFQNYNKANFIPYDQAEYYSVKYPKGWVVYQVSSQGGISLDSLLLLPKDVADKYIKTPVGKMLNNADSSRIFEALKKDKRQEIVVGGLFQYSEHVPPEDHEKYLKSVVQPFFENRNKNFGLNSKVQVIIFKGEPRIYTTSDWTRNNITTKHVDMAWFAKSDPKGRDKATAPVLITVSYVASPENFSEEIFNGVVDSIDENFLETYFDARSNTQTPPVNTQTNNSPSQSDTSNLKTYINTKYGFEFKYPVNDGKDGIYKVSGVITNENDVQFEPNRFLSVYDSLAVRVPVSDHSEYSPSFHVRIRGILLPVDLNTYAKNKFPNLYPDYSQTKVSLSEYVNINEVRWLKVTYLTTYRTHTEPPFHYYITIHNNNLYEMSLNGLNYTLEDYKALGLESIISTFKFTK